MPADSDLQASSTSTSLVQAEHVAKSYGSAAVLNDVTFTIRPGITGLLGSNGCGKTTLIAMFLGLHAPTGGTLRVLGHDPITDGAAIRERIGYSPEHHTLPGDIPANDFVQHVAELHGLPRREAVTRTSDALWLVGLGEERFRPLGTMSTGQRQRVKLAQAIAHDPVMVLLDEPTDGLDPVQRTDMLHLISRVSREYNISVVLSSHLLNEVELICNDVVIIGDGRVMAAGPLDELTGSQSSVCVDVATTEQAENLATWLTNHGTPVEVTQRRLIAMGDDDTIYDLVRDGVVSCSVQLEKLHQESASLEHLMDRYQS